MLVEAEEGTTDTEAQRLAPSTLPHLVFRKFLVVLATCHMLDLVCSAVVATNTHISTYSTVYQRDAGSTVEHDVKK
jgi:hypothetical protein